MIKKQQNKRLRDKWSKEDDQLMDIAILIFGENICAISQVVISKSQAQVYQRLRYLKERSPKKVVVQLF
ncbi:Homeobox-like_domain superfamily [Hexamita inflata]|uniref:Homeobox-like domain superfamily n=1 Tax=Hexamita inflata TaxID=28002 RepID=A0AA86R9X1_9EUKA|nr:Homeobox-like domain superfamily [Hexamita inflata]CAI9968734.1 Homeobox-like domain superfamily [Hexamita inflata]